MPDALPAATLQFTQTSWIAYSKAWFTIHTTFTYLLIHNGKPWL